MGIGVLVLGAAGLIAVLGPLREKPGLRAIVESGAGTEGIAETEPEFTPPSGHADRSPTQAFPRSGLPDTHPVGKSGPAGPAFPLANDLPAGMERAELIRLYGPPAMRTTAVERGVPVETWVYLREEPGARTVVRIRDGRVAVATTASY